MKSRAILSLADDQPWQAKGACATDPDVMFPDQKDRAGIRAAKQVCAGCPVLGLCREAHLDEAHGVWGGLDEAERRDLRRRRSRAA